MQLLLSNHAICQLVQLCVELYLSLINGIQIGVIHKLKVIGRSYLRFIYFCLFSSVIDYLQCFKFVSMQCNRISITICILQLYTVKHVYIQQFQCYCTNGLFTYVTNLQHCLKTYKQF